MKRWLKYLIAIFALILVIALWRSFAGSDGDEISYLFTEVLQTDLQSTVSSTGTLSAVEVVEVGTQISGQVLQVLADYNDLVEKGQLMALIDTEALDAAVKDAQARVVQAEAQQAQAEAQVLEAETNLSDAQATHKRNQPLVESGYLSQSEFQPIQTALQTAEANVRRMQAALRSAQAQVEQAQAQVTQARKDRRNAEIRAPISGIVLERSIEAGQTVAASFETPTLFILAENLEQMQILADVDESDIGQIKKSQPVTFTVPSFPDDVYDGIVREVRLQPNTEQNVVTYTVVVDVTNTDGKLLPGMTTTIAFVTDEATNVIAVPTAALRLQMTPEMQAALARNMPAPPEEMQGTGAPTGTPPENMRNTSVGVGPGGAPSFIWYLDADEQLQAIPVREGLSSGAYTEITPVGPNASLVKPGFRIIEQEMSNDDAAGFNGPGGGSGGPPPF